MKREDCWMTFSEALEEYLKARDIACTTMSRAKQEAALESMRDAAEHMDALAPLQEPSA